MPQRGTAQKESRQTTTPCGNPDRQPLDVAGRVNDLINCYLSTFGDYIKVYLPLVLIGLVLLVIMILAARELIEEGV